MHSHRTMSTLTALTLGSVLLFLVLTCEGKSKSSSGLDGRPTLPLFVAFPNHLRPEVKFDIGERIGAAFRSFVPLLLKDDDGYKLDNLKHTCRDDPVCINHEAFKKWLGGRGLTPIKWTIMIKVLRDIKEYSLADDIENYFLSEKEPLNQTDHDQQQEETLVNTLTVAAGTEDEHTDYALDATDLASHEAATEQYEVPRGLNFEEQLSHISKLVFEVNKIAQSVHTYLNLTKNIVHDISNDLLGIFDKLQNNSVRIGVVGLTKAGKSSFLNALLGKHFLPSSIQPQTANEVVIVHNMSTPDGELYCVKSKGHKPFLLASGSQEVFNELLKLNNQRRDREKTASCDKLVLHAPLQFLAEKGVQELKFEISDTPGYGEAGSRDINTVAEATVRQMSAFVLILNSRYLKSKSEWELLKDLKKYHPEIFSKLNRVLVLFNHYDIFFSDRSSASLNGTDAPQYISNYMKELEGYYISPARILPLSAKWALKARTWKNASVLAEDPDRDILYREAMLMMHYFGEKEKAQTLEKEMSVENIATMVSLLESFSQIQFVEKRLKEMTVIHRDLVLLESALDDTVAIIGDRLLPVISDLESEERLDSEAKEEFVRSFEKLDGILNSTTFVNDIFDALHSFVESVTRQQMSDVCQAMHDSFRNTLTDKLMTDLKRSYELRNKSEVIAQMSRMKDTIPKAALAIMNNHWVRASEEIRKDVSRQVKMFFTDIRTDFLSAVNQISRQPHNSNNVIESISATIDEKFSVLGDNSASLLPNAAVLSISNLNFTDKDGHLDDHVESSNITEPSTTLYIEDCSCSLLFFWCECDSIPVTSDYVNITVYSPNLISFQSSFNSDFKKWMDLFNDQIDTYTKTLTATVSTSAKSKVLVVLKSQKHRVQGELQSGHDAWSKRKSNISHLEQKVVKLKELKRALRKPV